MVKLEKKSPKAAAPKAKKGKAKPVKVVEEEESEESSEEEEEMEVQTTKAQPAKGKVVAEASDDEEEEDSDDDEEDDDDEEEDSDEEEEDDSEESEVEGQNGKTTAAKGKEEEEEDSDDEDDDDSEEEEDEDEEEAPKAATKRKAETKAAVPAKKAKAEEEDEEDSDDDDDDDDDEEESDDEEEDEDEDSDEEDEEEDEEEETPQLGKRKAKGAVKEESPAKKAKVEGEQSTLFVGNLTEKVTEEKLRKFFKKKGLEVLDLRYLTKSSGVSLAYVDVPAAEEATALELNGATVAGTELKVEKAKSKKQEPKSPKSPGQNQSFGSDGDRDARTLFLRNLSYDSTKESIMEVFTDAVDVRIPIFKDSGRPKGIAFVEFESEAKVEEVKSSMDGVEVDGRSVGMDYVGSKAQFTGRPQSKSPGGGFGAPATPSKTLVVKNLSYDTTSESLKEAFEGSKDARVIMKPGTDRSRGFGYVDFESEEAAKEAMDSMNQSELDGRTINVEFGMSRSGGGGGGGGGFGSPAQASKTLIAKNLSYDTGEDDLQQAFEGCISARVITDRETGRSKGFGYIDFDSEDAAKEALKNMDGQDVGGRGIRLDFALPRGEGGGRGMELG